ncbi:glutamate--tRNA ligase [Candidatus Kaiserbacteria bacterium RIFOXYB1_FULL_46_14]|uniref:Glutamate--tRNA ligase n=1 Tax=Candidatus Kaiserbacteria bacterium RIFOXYB1_FULL_46_14 TaxID=1798531 RepID=A0A1F6FJG0_9BACT|nr:MAG: glutamate--tRNA ligase [Candidatus Kaiserbacteria bacterium RIFOXYB1_FULL_46_14]
MITTRIPPSPTGHLHIGTVRTALFNYLFSRHYKGRFVFRSEDTDKARSKKEFEVEIIEGLQALGLTWDNTEEVVRQSERGEIYRRYLEEGIGNGKLFLSQEESKQNPGETVEVVRLKNPNKEIVFNDLIRGEIAFDTTELGDLVVARSIDDALYHFTVVVDDHEMGVTHVLRGEDHISNTPRQILIQEALGFERPEYAHLPLILAPDRSKMSKRHGAVAVAEYLNEGFLPEAIINYLALLGWNPGTDQEIFTLEELVEQFDIAKVHKSGAVFDRQKFLWINKEHLNRLSDDVYLGLLKTALPDSITSLSQYDDERMQRLMPTIRERINIFGEFTDAAAAGEYDFAFAHPDVDPALLKWKKDPDLTASEVRLRAVYELLQNADFSSPESIKAAVWDYAEKEGRGEVLWPMRVALTGLERSPDPFTVAHIIGREDTLHRIKIACDKIGE